MATTWNPSDKGAGVTLSGGNLGASVLASGVDSVRATASEVSGKWYYEFTVTSGSGAGFNLGVGVANSSAAITGAFLGSDANAMVYRGSDGAVKQNATTRATFATFGSGDVIGVAFDATGRTVSFYKNNVLQGTLSTNVPTGALFPVVGGEGGGFASAGTANFGATATTYAPPTGYSAIDSSTNSFSMTMSGGVVVGGDAAIFNPAIVAMSGGVIVGGSATVVAYSGHGDIIATAPKATGSLTVGFSNYGVLRATASGAHTAVLTGYKGVSGIVLATTPKATGSFVAGPQRITAKAPKATGVLTALLGGTTTVVGRAARTTGTLTAVVTGYATLTGSAGRVTGTVTAAQSGVAVIAAKARRASGVMTAYVTVSGTVTASAPLPTSEFTGGMGIIATIVATVGVPTGRLVSNRALDALVNEVVVNSITGAVTEYAHYDFDSFAIVGGTYYAAGADGIYELDSGGTDDGAAIDASFETGALSFKSEYLKRLESLYSAYRTSGDLLVSVRTDEGKQYTYSMKWDKVPNIKQRRVPVGKGLKGKYWQIKMENVAGASFGFDTFNILAHETVRRIGV